MKKKLFSLTIVFILIGVMGLTACSKKSVGVDMFDKTYTIKTEATYSIQIGLNNPTYITDDNEIKEWLTTNWENIDNKHNTSNVEELIAYFKNENNYSNTEFIKGATIVIGKGIKINNKGDKKGSFTVTIDKHVLKAEVETNNWSTNYPLYKKGKITGDNISSFQGDGFELTKYDEKNGTISDIIVRFYEGELNGETPIKIYQNCDGMEIALKDGEYAQFNIIYSLANVK